jgi:HD-GYP domain-containing protein (c-di-GMP phosphodiesterase class II)
MNETNPKVYLQSEEASELLQPIRNEMELVAFTGNLPANEAARGVIVAGNPSVFTKAIGEAVAANRARILYILPSGDQSIPASAEGIPVFGFLISPLQLLVLKSMLRAGFENLELTRSQSKLQSEVASARTEIDELNAIGIALSTAPDTAALLELILRKSREITDSDAGSLYLAEDGEQGEKRLRFKLAQNDSLKVPFAEFTIPINASSIAGYVALTGEPLHLEDAYKIPADKPYRFNSDFDSKVGYRTMSMLVVPMKNPQGEIIGVVQLINCKQDESATVNPTNARDVVIPYPEGRRALVSSLASQAAVAIENNRLYENIQSLFEGFVKASVTAIESRDPTTSGHSFRVADLTVGFAEAVDRAEDPHFRPFNFTRSEMKEIRYASLLHDFGKVGVREEVLVKAKKLYPLQAQLVRERFDFVRKAAQHEHAERKLNYLLEKGREDFMSRLNQFDTEMQERLKELDDFLKFVMQCNEPTVLPEGDFHRLSDLSAMQFLDWDGTRRPLLNEDEVRMLSIPKGSLDDSERRQIESHVTHTFNFLSQIPWTKELRHIPEIARGHHEKLNGSGYPYKLAEPQIPMQTRMMTISDIFDALTASDRPYKRALPTEKALDILKMEAGHHLIDTQLFNLFVEGQIYKKALEWKPAAP